MMIDEILQALVNEAQAYVKSIADPNLGTGTVLLLTNFKDEQVATYGMPLIVLSVPDAPETSLYIGGNKRADWNCGFSSYHYMPDAEGNDPTNYSTQLLQIIDLITDHFAAGLLQNGWLTQGMRDILNNYCYKMTLEGIGTADDLGKDGLIMGFKTNFGSLAISRRTSQSLSILAPLDTVTQVDNPPFT